MTFLRGAAGWSLCSHCDSSCCVCTERLLCASPRLCSGEGRVTREREDTPALGEFGVSLEREAP